MVKINNKNIKVYPVTENYFDYAIKFDSKYNNIIEEIKNIYYDNLNNKEKNLFLNIIENAYDDENDEYQEDVQIINNISKDENLKEFIKEYISISMIKNNENVEDNFDDEKFKIILFIPTEIDNIKEKIIKYIEESKSKNILDNILFGSLDYYNIEEY